MSTTDLLFLLLLLVTLYCTIRFKKLTLAGALVAGLIGGAVYLGAGMKGISLLGSFFLLGTLTTAWQSASKISIGAATNMDGQRNAGQVLANGGVAALCGVMAWLFPNHSPLLQLMMAASLAAATADTISAELGTVYGSKFYNSLNFTNGRRGDDGVVSLEGTLAGIAGAAIIAGVHLVFTTDFSSLPIILLAGALGNLADSLLGATLEKRKILNNDGVNFLNTLTGALVAWLLSLLMSQGNGLGKNSTLLWL